MRKHQSSLRLCWRRYCKRALKQNLKAYSWASFVFFYGQFRKPCSDEDDPKDKVRNKLKRYNLMLLYCNPNGEQYQKLKKEKEEWLKSLHLDESRIIDITHKHLKIIEYIKIVYKNRLVYANRLPFTSFCCIIYKNAIGAIGKVKAKCDKLHDYEMNVAPYSERKAIYYEFTTCLLLSLQNNSGLRKSCRHSVTSIINNGT